MKDKKEKHEHVDVVSAPGKSKFIDALIDSDTGDKTVIRPDPGAAAPDSVDSLPENSVARLERFFSESAVVDSTGRSSIVEHNDSTKTVTIAFVNSEKGKVFYSIVLDTSRKSTSIIPTVVDEEGLCLRISNCDDGQLYALANFLMTSGRSY